LMGSLEQGNYRDSAKILHNPNWMWNKLVKNHNNALQVGIESKIIST
jgi:hypothetical protein